MRCLVTGGAGFIGSHVVDELLKAGHTVVALDDLSGGFVENVNPGAEFIRCSVTDAAALKKIFEKYKFDYVYHLAAYAAEGLSHFIRKFNYENNLVGSINLINCAIQHNVKHFVFTSSIAVYGAGQTPFRESTQPIPEDPYGISKLAVEQDLIAAERMFGLNYTIFRPHNVYGSRQNCGDPYRNVLGIFFNNILQNKKMSIFGDGAQTRAFTHITDVAPYIARAPEVPAAKNEIINIGADRPYTVLQLAKMISAAMGVSDDAIEFLPARNEVKDASSDHSKAARIFDIKNYVSLEEGIAKMAKWAGERGVMSGRKFENIEIEKNMPPSWKKLF